MISFGPRHVLVVLTLGVMIASGCTTTAQTTQAAPTPVAPATSTPVDSEPPVASPVPELTAEPAPTVVPSQTPVPDASAEPTAPSAANTDGDQAEFVPVVVDGTIEGVDFLNGFTYVTGWGDPVTVQDGAAIVGSFGDENFLDFFVDRVAWGDLDGDGLDEAAVTTVSNTGGSGFFSSVDVYQIVDGLLQHVGPAAGGDRAHGGVYDAAIVDGYLIIEQFGTDQGACCPNMLSQSRWVLGDRSMIALESDPPRTWMPLESFGEVQELEFLAGTSSAMLTVYGSETQPSFTFEARQGQRFRLLPVAGARPDNVTLLDGSTADIVLSGEPMIDLVLPASGSYEVVVDFGQAGHDRATLHVSISAGTGELLPTWVPSFDQVVHSVEPEAISLLTWPTFVSGGDESGLARVNVEVERFVRDHLATWLADLEIRPDAHSASGFELVYDVTLVAPDLVSIHFNYYDYVCCRPYPNTGQRAVIADLTSGRLLELGELIDLARLDELQELWTDVVEQELGGDLSEFLEPGRVEFSALSFVPNGIELGTDRGTFGGAAVGPMRTVLTFDQLGSLIDAEIVARVARDHCPKPFRWRVDVIDPKAMASWS